MGEFDNDDLDRYLQGDFDDLDDEDQPEVRCRDCGSEDVYWAQVDGRWVLFGLNSRRHRCNKGALTERRLEAFDNLD